MNRFLYIFLLIALTGITACNQKQSVNWPEITNETKPWTRWWWHGSTVTNNGLTANMEEMESAGIGGVEITPIYDVKGFEEQAISFQSSEWMKVFEHTLIEGKRLGLGIDLANAAGWPFGGPWVGAEDACKNVHYKKYSLKGGQKLEERISYVQEPMLTSIGNSLDISEIKFPITSNSNLQELALTQVRFEKPLPLQSLMAYSNSGTILDLTKEVGADGKLNWQAPDGNWELYAVFQGWHGKMVERAGTGGEGNVIDHFSEEALRKFLKDFDDKSKEIDVSGLRAFFNDSYEVDDASGQSNWTPLFFEEFKNRRGYDLKHYLPALFGNDSESVNSRVLCDYRETISDLLLERFTRVWADWAKTHNAVIRNQAHGSPANILDLYEVSDIPETEGINPMRIKMATSAGHVSGKPLIACEAATWLDEHFLATLDAVKQNLDRYLANGVNHIVYHGTPYSPLEEKWPGWMFYAAVHFAPTNSWWNDLKTINQYITNCQSFMQNSTPDNDILLYFPIYDSWSDRGSSLLKHFGHKTESLTKELSEMLMAKGYTFDYISDKQIQKLTVDNKQISAPGANYKTILIPFCNHIPLKTMQQLMSLANSGANIIFQDQLPESVQGLANLENRKQIYETLVKSINLKDEGDFSAFETGNGKLLVGSNIEGMLTSVKVKNEELAELGLWFNRVEREEGTCYFVSNWSDKKVDKWVSIQSSGQQAALFNPMNKKVGKAKIRKTNDGQSDVYLQLNPGETLILQWYPNKIDLNTYPLWQVSEEQTLLQDDWDISFVNGGPTLPASYKTTELSSWTEQSEELEKFSGTASYKTSFKKPQGNALAYQLNLGKVRESAVVFLNGKKLNTLVGPVFQVTIDSKMLKENNQLEIHVSNLMANRIIDMDKQGMNYKKFYNINFASKKPENRDGNGVFTAAKWEPLESGLLGPVRLIALREL